MTKLVRPVCSNNTYYSLYVTLYRRPVQKEKEAAEKAEKEKREKEEEEERKKVRTIGLTCLILSTYNGIEIPMYIFGNSAACRLF